MAPRSSATTYIDLDSVEDMRIIPNSLYDVLKRLGDITIASLALIASIPLQVFLALKVKKHLGRPVIFSQERPGLDGQIFTLYKFRSMLVVDEARGHVTNEDRMTPFGSWLRATSFDELPSLWNVLRGDMSLVGPRPLKVEYLDRYDKRQAIRHEVRPGITGLAQVSGRNSLSWAERLELDAQYVEKRSVLLDIAILWKTFATVFSREGIAEPGQATMSEFKPVPPRRSNVECRQLLDSDLKLRETWLSDERIRDGISIDFWPDSDSMLAWYKRSMADESRRDFAVLDDGAVVAMVGLVNIANDAAEIYIYVDPNRHGAGYGRHAMRTLIAEASALGLRRLTLETKKENFAAKALYVKTGFSVDTEDARKIYMSLDIV